MMAINNASICDREGLKSVEVAVVVVASNCTFDAIASAPKPRSKAVAHAPFPRFCLAVKAHDFFLLPAWMGSDPCPDSAKPLRRWTEFNAPCGLSHREPQAATAMTHPPR